MLVPLEFHERKKSVMEGLRTDRRPWWEHWREISDYVLPRRYIWLLGDEERHRIKSKNPFILDSTGTQAARTLASGMMNGITSPSRPWFKLRIPAFDAAANVRVRSWLDEVQRRMLLVLAQSNFYNNIAITYLDLSVFGTSAMLIYEDPVSVVRFYNSPLGEFYLAQSARQQVNTFGREFRLQVHQVVERWGLENCSPSVQALWLQGGAVRHKSVNISHLIEPNDGRYVSRRFPYRECYWETGGVAGQLLESRGFFEIPGIFPRWELMANDSYGSSPAMEALPDIIQLQQETKRKAQGLDKVVSPPIVADVQLQHKPMALMPNGVTYVAGVNNVGAKPLYTVTLPLDMLTADIREVQARIRETFHNDLFRMISQLDTVRSATEIDARREEKLVLLGPVLERFENEALDPLINRVFSIMDRAGLLPPPPREIEGAEFEIQYVSILTAAQTAVAAIPTERWLQLIAGIAPIYPGAVNVPNWDDLIRNYGRDIGVRAQDMRSPEEVAQVQAQQQQMDQLRQTAEIGGALAEGAKTLSQAEVGGGANALQRIIG